MVTSTHISSAEVSLVVCLLPEGVGQCDLTVCLEGSTGHVVNRYSVIDNLRILDFLKN